MEYPFRTDKVYFSGPEERHLAEFVSQMPECGRIYTKKDGDKRFVGKVTLPKGIKTDLTATGGMIDERGNRWYHTPLAKLDGVLARVDFKDEDTGEWGSATSEEWLEWIGESISVKDPPPQKETGMDKYVETCLKAVKEGKVPPAQDFTAKMKGDEWRSPTGRIKTPIVTPAKKHSKKD